MELITPTLFIIINLKFINKNQIPPLKFINLIQTNKNGKIINK